MGTKISPLTVSWILVFILIAFAEEILNRGFLWQFYEDVKYLFYNDCSICYFWVDSYMES